MRPVHTGLTLAFLCLMLSVRLTGAATTISVNAGTVVNSYVPYNAFGSNVVSWSDPRTVQTQIQAAGNFIERFPGGSWADSYHWNGTGSTDANGYWVPSSTTATIGTFTSTIPYAASNVLDGNTGTVWKSNPDTDFPNAQYLYTIFASQQSVNSLKVTWGTPYASKFTVQYWNPSNGQQWMIYTAPTNGWTNTTAVNWTSTGGAQTITFTAVTTGYLRLLMTQSSGGAGAVYSVAELHPFSGATAVTLTASGNQVNPSSLYPVGTGAGWVALSFDQYMGMMNSMTPKGSPLITVNTGTGTPQEAAAWVYYANITKGYGIKYWEIGNEMGGDWETGGPLNAQDYGRRYIAFVQAMKAVDPTIVCIGGAGSGYSSTSELYDGNGYIQDFINRLASDSGGNKASWAEGIVIHDYPGNGSTPAQKLSGLATEMPAMASALSTQLVNHPSASTVPIWITEFNSWASSDANDITVRLANGLFLGEYLGEYLNTFGSRGYTQLWATLNGGDAYTSTTGSDLGYLGGNSPYTNQPHASYWAMQMLAADWSVLGDKSSYQVLSATSSQALLRSYANLRPDGSLGLVVVNTDPTNSYTTTVNLTGFNPVSQAHAWRLSSTEYVWETTTSPYHASTDTGPTYLTITGISNSFSYTFPAYSMMVLKIDPVTSSPTPTPSSTPYAGTPTSTYTSTMTPSPTVTVTPICSQLINGMETLTDNGTWSGNNSVRSIVTSASAPAGAITQGTHCMAVNVTVSAGWNDSFANLSGFTPANLSSYSTLSLDINVPASFVTGSSYCQMLLYANCSSLGIWYQPIASAGVNLVAGQQTLTWTIDYTAGTIPAGSNISDIILIMNNNATAPIGTAYLDNLRLAGFCATSTFTVSPTPTPTPTGTATPTASPSPSATATASPTASPSATPSASPTGTPTATPSRTFSSTPSNSPSATPTASPTVTLTSTKTATGSPTSTPTASPTSSSTSTGTSTITPSFTVSPAWTFTVSPTVTQTRTVTPTSSPTSSFTGTPSLTSSPSATATSSPSATPSFTRTVSPTSTPTLTFTQTPTFSVTQTPTSSSTPSATFSPSATASFTRTITLTSTPTSTLTVSPTATPTLTASPTATPTLTPSDTATLTSSPTVSATLTVTATYSATPTVSDTATASPTATPTLTATQSATSTDSFTPSPVVSDTATPTVTVTQSSPTSTVTPTLSVTKTNSPTRTPTATRTSTQTRTVSPTATPTWTITRSLSSTPSQSPSPTLTPSATPTATLVPLLSQTSTTTPSPTLSPTGIASHVLTYDGPLEIKQVLMAPNPATGNQAWISLQLAGSADGLKWSIYTPAMVKVQQSSLLAPMPAGWASESIDISGLPNGLFYLVVEATRNGGGVSVRKIARLMILR